MRSTFYLLIIILLTGCSTINYISIETQNPAQITFPKSVKNLLIVHNAVPQPPTVGYEYKLFDVSQDSCRARADSALLLACQALGKAIVQAETFNDVRLYNIPIRKDEEFLFDQRLTPEQVTALCEETGTDAVISLDRLLFKMDKVVSKSPIGDVRGEIKVYITGVLRSHLPNRDAALATVILTDSLTWSEYAENLDILNLFIPDPATALEIAAITVGEKSLPNFSPYWEKEYRWYYTSLNAQWKEAAAYAKAGKWELAGKGWQSIYTKANDWKSKAKAAANTALACEMQGEIADAIKWVETSLDLYNKNTQEDSSDKQMLSIYVNTLVARALDDKKLDMQIGAE